MHSHVVLALEVNNMKSSQTIFNKDQGTVTLSAVEYNKLLLYKELALEMKEILQGDDSWVSTTGSNHHQPLN